MNLVEKHHIKVSHHNWKHCDLLSYIIKNLYNSSMFYIKQEYFWQEKHKESLVGLSCVCGQDMANYINQNSFIIERRQYLDNNQIKFTNQYSFDFVHLNKHFIDSKEYKTQYHEDYIQLQQDYQTELNNKINYYESLTKQDYWKLRSNTSNKKFKNKTTKAKSFNAWKKHKINKLKQQLNIPININTKILKQTQRQINQDFSNYFASLKSYYQDKNKFLGRPDLPRYKQKGSLGRTTVTVPKEAISYISHKKIINHELIKSKSEHHGKRYNKQTQLGVSRLKNKQKYFISIANMNIIVETAIHQEQIKEIKIVPCLNPKVNGYNILIIYDEDIKLTHNVIENINIKTNKKINQVEIEVINKSKIDKEEVKSKELNIKLKKLVEEIQNLQSINKEKLQTKKQHELTEFIQTNELVIASADIGMNNLLTLTTTNPNIKPVIINGSVLKSINQRYNKLLANYKSELSSHGLLTSRMIQQLTHKRNQRIEDFLHQASSFVVDWLVNNNISAIILGKNINWKQEINIGKINNQNFVQIPYAKLIEKIQYKCKRKNILVILQEEAYTSKASFLDLDLIPTYSKDNNLHYSGKRIHRGLYKSLQGIFINADVNGSLNILRKVIGNDLFIKSNSIRDWAVNPERINLNGRNFLKTLKYIL